VKLKDISEDLAVPIFNNEKMPDFSDRKTSSIIGTSDQLHIWGSRFYGPSIDAYAILVDDDKNLTPKAILCIEAEEQNIEGLKFQNIYRIWVDPKYRGKALSTILMNFVIKKMKTNIGSGKLVTGDGEKLFKNLIVKKPFDMIVVDFKKNVKLDEIPKDLFEYPNNYVIVSTDQSNESLGSSLSKLFGKGQGILSEMCRYIKEDGEPFGDWE
jgi:GNAT superfamily N-acetyltransferase